MSSRFPKRSGRHPAHTNTPGQCSFAAYVQPIPTHLTSIWNAYDEVSRVYDPLSHDTEDTPILHPPLKSTHSHMAQPWAVTAPRSRPPIHSGRLSFVFNTVRSIKYHPVNPYASPTSSIRIHLPSPRLSLAFARPTSMFTLAHAVRVNPTTKLHAPSPG